MIFDVIDRKINEMKNLRRLELIKENHKQQVATDAKYKSLVSQVSDFLQAIKYARDNLGFPVMETIGPDMFILLGNLKGVVASGYADKDAVVKAEGDFKSIQVATKKEWSKYFHIYTSATTSTLKVISGIDSDRVVGCRTDINAAEIWTVDIEVFYKLKKAIENANSIIKELNLDAETELFLTKMTSGRATIADLNEHVLNWIKKESLESKIKLSFTAR